MNRSLKDILKVSQALKPQTVTGDIETAGVDVQDFESLTFVAEVGSFAFSGTNKLTVKLQDADVNTDGSFADCVAADAFGDVAKVLDSTDDQDTAHLFHYKGSKRYARLAVVEAGTVSVAMGVTAIKGHGKNNPAL